MKLKIVQKKCIFFYEYKNQIEYKEVYKLFKMGS